VSIQGPWTRETRVPSIKERFDTRRCVLLTASKEGLESMLQAFLGDPTGKTREQWFSGYPQDIQVSAINYNPEDGLLYICVCHPSFEVVEHGALIPKRAIIGHVRMKYPPGTPAGPLPL
jgi:hypothetical protein